MWRITKTSHICIIRVLRGDKNLCQKTFEEVMPKNFKKLQVPKLN